MPVRDCGIANICADGPIRVLLADTLTHRIRVLARYRNDLDRRESTISADGSLLAAPAPGTRVVNTFDTKSGRIVSSFSHESVSLSPVAFIDNSMMLLTGSSVSNTGGDDLYLARIEFGRVRIQEVAKDLGPPVIGWTH